MFVSWRSSLLSGLPNKHFPGNSYRICSLRRFNYILSVIVLLGFASCGFCHEFDMVSAPLGFEIYGFDRSKNWVSENGVFEFGFFENDVGGFVVGIRYRLGNNKAAQLPVWTVGGGLRVSKNSTFRLSMDGRLILSENPSESIVWSSNTSNLGVQKATLLNNGDFVLVGVDNNVLWESFNSPTNTLLPGQSLRYPQNLRAPSKKPISSYYSFVIHRSGELALVWEDNVTYWRSHSSSSISTTVKEAKFDANGVLGLYGDDDDKNKLIWSVTSKDFGDPSINLRHLRIDQDGNLRIYSWDGSINSWRVDWQAVEDQCNVFGFCGSYSVCGYNSTSPICNCLYSDPTEMGLDVGGSLCKKMVDLDNCRMRTSMLPLKQTFLYGLYPPHDFDIMLSEESCKNYCSNDTSCIAVTSKNDGSGLCTIKRTTFISGLATPYIPSTSFLKVCFVPQAVSARGANPNGNTGSISLLPGQVKSQRGNNGKRFIGAISIIAFVTVSLILSMEVLGFWFINRRRKMNDEARSRNDKMNPHYSAIIRLSFEEIKELTNNFAVQLGPSVYKGTLPNKTSVVAKVINNAAAVVTEKEFRMAVSIVGGTHHRNLVLLKGFCFDPKKKVLLYEYVQNGSLDNWLLKDEGKNWQKRLDISLGIVHALAYLHTECQTCITHGNLKLENVLLDENLVPKVTDFGIHSLLQKEEDASCSSSPVSQSEKDIYKLGEMLLQIVLRKRDIVFDSVDHVISQLNQEQECMASDYSDTVERMVRIALWCMQSQPFLRPSIGEVVKVLEGTLSVDRPPVALAVRHEDAIEIEG